MIDRLKRLSFRFLVRRLVKSENDIPRIFLYLQEVLGTNNKLRDWLLFDKILYDLILIEGARVTPSHPKHRYLRYANWFGDHLCDNDTVLDVGSGRGELTSYLATRTKQVVWGIEIDSGKVKKCFETYRQENLKFVLGDITKSDLSTFGTINVVTLSNVLEHIEDRQELLQAIHCLQPRLLLVRVPQYDRDWKVPVKEEYGIDPFLDPTHVIEYTEAQLEDELKRGGFEITEKKFNWGEIWAVCRPR